MKQEKGRNKIISFFTKNKRKTKQKSLCPPISLKRPIKNDSHKVIKVEKQQQQREQKKNNMREGMNMQNI